MSQKFQEPGRRLVNKSRRQGRSGGKSESITGVSGRPGVKQPHRRKGPQISEAPAVRQASRLVGQESGSPIISQKVTESMVQSRSQRVYKTEFPGAVETKSRES
jgi:hypothetical protein